MPSVLLISLLLSLNVVPIAATLSACPIPAPTWTEQALAAPDYGAQYTPGAYLNSDRRAAVIQMEKLVLSETEKERLTPRYPDVAAFFADYPLLRKNNPAFTLLLLLRHGEAMSNVFKIVQDHETASPLSIRGVKHRDAFFDFMSALMRRIGLHFDSYTSSDLERAFDTLHPLAQSAGQAHVTLKRFREIKNLIIGGINYKRAFRLFPDYGQSFRLDPDKHTLAPRYSIKRVRAHIDDFLEKLEQSPGRHAIVASHGNAIYLTMLSLLKIPSEKFPAMRAQLGHDIQNVAITVFVFDPLTAAWTLQVYADNTYLPEKLRHHTDSAVERLLNRLRLWAIILTRAIHPTLRKNPYGLADWFGSWRQFFPPSDRSIMKAVGRNILKYET